MAKHIAGVRNVMLVLATLAVQTVIALNAIWYETDMAQIYLVLGAIGATAVGGVYGRGYNKSAERK